MNLFIKISKEDIANYRKEFIECLTHNSKNSYIKNIFVYTNEIDHNIKSVDKTKVYYKRSLPTDSHIVDYSKSFKENKIIFSDPFIKFEEDLYKVTDGELDNFVITGNGYYIYSMKTSLVIKSVNFEFTKKEKSLQLKTSIIRRSSNVEKKQNDSQVLVKKSVYRPPQILPTKRYKKLDVIIVSVDYNDYLVLTLKHNIKIFNNITVVTSKNDVMCQEICKRYQVNCILTDVMYEGDAKFNKGKAINVGINSLVNPDLILLLDADIIVEESINLQNLSDEALYTSERIILLNYTSYKDYLQNGKNKRTKLENDKGYGFFQLFCINNTLIDKEKPFPENSKDASYSDLEFRDKFYHRKTISQPCLHLGEPFRNWKGRQTEKFISGSEFDSILYKKSTFTICSYYFNYKEDVRQKNNFIKFLEQWKDYYENMIVGIVDYGDIDFEIPCKSLIIKGDLDNKIWSKEILINKIIETVDTDYFIWIDGDLIYENLDWLNNLDSVIGNNDFVQLFENINYLSEDGEILESHKSLVSGDINNIDRLLNRDFKPGGSWMTKTTLLKSKPLFEKMLVGGGDTILAYGLFGVESGSTLNKIKEGSVDIYEKCKEWINDFGKRKCGYLDVNVNHLYHGDLKDRNYVDRYKILEEKNVYQIVVFTENIGDYDELPPIGKFKNTKCIAFLDKDMKVEGWETINVNKIENLKKLKNSKLICKYIRTHSQELLPKHEYSIHIDANMTLLKDPNIILEEILNKEHEIMAFKHYKRNNLYDEAKQCIEWKLDSVIKIENQIKKYKSENVTGNLYECGFLLRKNTKDVAKFDNLWWNEIISNSYRDQISFAYLLEKSKIKFRQFNHDNRMKSDYLTIKEIKNGETHKGSRIYNNNLIMIYEDNREKWGSTKMRGFDISNKIKCNIIPLSNSKNVKYKKMIILKISSYEKIIKLTEYNEVIIDMVDFNENIHDLSIFKNFDYGIFTSIEQLKKLSNIFKYPEKCKVIYHHWDERFRNIKIKNHNSVKVCYFGQPEKCFNFNQCDEIDYHTIDWYDFDDKINRYSEYNVHFGVKPQQEEDKIQPLTKISTASSLCCPIIVNKSNQNKELLGEEYPYYCSPDEESVNKTLLKIKSEFETDNWLLAKRILYQIKQETDLNRVSKKYLDL